jgi:hypothetical protein
LARAELAELVMAHWLDRMAGDPGCGALVDRLERTTTPWAAALHDALARLRPAVRR